MRNGPKSKVKKGLATIVRVLSEKYLDVSPTNIVITENEEADVEGPRIRVHVFQGGRHVLVDSGESSPLVQFQGGYRPDHYKVQGAEYCLTIGNNDYYFNAEGELLDSPDEE